MLCKQSNDSIKYFIKAKAINISLNTEYPTVIQDRSNTKSRPISKIFGPIDIQDNKYVFYHFLCKQVIRNITFFMLCISMNNNNVINLYI